MNAIDICKVGDEVNVVKNIDISYPIIITPTAVGTVYEIYTDTDKNEVSIGVEFKLSPGIIMRRFFRPNLLRRVPKCINEFSHGHLCCDTCLNIPQ